MDTAEREKRANIAESDGYVTNAPASYVTNLNTHNGAGETQSGQAYPYIPQQFMSLEALQRELYLPKQ